MEFYLALYDSQQKKLAMLYLFLSAQRRIRNADFEIFEQIGSAVEGFKDSKGAVIGECEKALAAENAGYCRDQIVTELLSKYAASEGEKDKRALLWMLLGVTSSADESFEIRKKLITLFVEKGRIDGSLFDEMRDTYEAIHAIAGLQEWMETYVGMSKSQILSETVKITQFNEWLKTSAGMLYEQVRLITLGLEKDLNELQQSANSLIEIG
jgi:hypothetical protein